MEQSHAQALCSLIRKAKQVLVVGHRSPDMDSLGAACGAAAICRRIGVPCRILRPDTVCPAERLYHHLSETQTYRSMFLTPTEAAGWVSQTTTLLLLVDVSRREVVMAPELLEQAGLIGIVDHHARGLTWIQNADLWIQDTKRSSTAEMFCCMIQELMEPQDLLPAEADALLAGLMLDTRNFCKRCTAATFQAAAMLCSAGGDTARVQKLQQISFGELMARHAITASCRFVRPGVALAVSHEPAGRIAIAQAADELLSVSGVGCSFVLSPEEDIISISGRSTDGTNVQSILEQLHGGGNPDAAGAQVSGKSLDQVVQDLEQAILSYFGPCAPGSPA